MSRIGQNPEIVTYVEGDGKQHTAIVIGSRYIEHHAGQNDEPLLTLAFASQHVPDECARCQQPEHRHGKPSTLLTPPCPEFIPPAPKPVIGFEQNLHVVHDVPHSSHEFGDDLLAELGKKGITYPGNKIPGGRWVEYTARDLAVKGGLIRPPSGTKEEDSTQVDTATSIDSAADDSDPSKKDPTIQ